MCDGCISSARPTVIEIKWFFDPSNSCKTKHASSGDDTLIHDENRVARPSTPMKVESIYTDGTRIRLISYDTGS